MDDRRGFLDPYGSVPPGFDRGTIVVSGADPIRGPRRERHQKGRFVG